MEYENRNKNRDRYYGLRIGDTVKVDWFDGELIVVAYGGSDNNSIYLMNEWGDGKKCTAEECKIIKKCEEIKQ